MKLTCQHGNSGNWYTVFDMAPGDLSPTTGRTWEGEIHLGSNCKIDLSTSAASGGVAGTVKVCGEQLTLDPPWTGNFSGSMTIPFVVRSDACLPRGCPSQPATAGAKSVDVAFTSILPGSAWLNETPPAGETVHLPFDDTLSDDGTLLVRDVSGVGQDISCTGTTCPIPGQPGHSGSAALFDGVDDGVYSPYIAGYDTSDVLSIAAWIKPTGAPGGDGTFLARKSRYLVARTSDGTIRWAFSNAEGFKWHSTGYKAPDNQWTHIVVVYDNAVVRTYANGALVHTYTTAGSITNNSWLEVGGYSSSGHFTGLIDDVRFFKTAITENEVKRLYTGSDPVLTMSFEAPLANGGVRVVDTTTWGNDGTLGTGTTDAQNKTMLGQVGNYALKLDGADDTVAIDNFGVFTTTTVSAWIYRTGPTTATGRETIVSYKEDAGCGFVLALESQSPKFWIHANGTWYNIADGSGQAPLNQWVHLAAVHDGGHMRIYRNGVQVKAGYFSNAPVSMDNLCTGATAIGSRNSLDQHWFPGGIDEVRIYGRALNGNEIADLYNAGWHTGIPATSGANVESTSWTMAVPTATLGFEGTYRLDLRGGDMANHSQAVSERSHLWTGEIDNLGPRVTLCRALVTAAQSTVSTYRYVTVAQDYNLVETGFSSPCAISSRTNFRSPWVLGTLPAGTDKLYQVRAECELDTATLQAKACDQANNCTTVGLTNGGACDSILAGRPIPQRLAE